MRAAAPPRDCVRRQFCQYGHIEKPISASPGWLNRGLAWFAVVSVFVSLCFRLGHLPLLAPDEGRNVEVAREMKESGAWLVPTYNGLDYLDKPAFYFKAVALSLAVLGNSETAARIPSAAFGVALVIVVFLFCRKVYGTRCGLLASIIVATTPLYLANARTVIFDIVLAFFVCAAIFAGYLAEAAEGKARRNWYLLGAAAAGFGTLVKGPVGFIIPALVLLVFNRIERRRGAWKRLLAPLNLLVFFGIALPWFVGLCLARPDFLHYGLVEESFNRFTSSKTFHRSEPVYFYLIIVAATFFPWSLLLPGAALATWKERWAKHGADRLCLVWSVVVLLFFSISQSKLPGYILSVTVACGILVARVFEAALATPEGKPARIVRVATVVYAVTCLLLALAAVAGMPHMGVLAKPLRIPVTDAERLGQTLVPLVVLFAAFGALAWTASQRRSASLCFLCLALFGPLGANLSVRVFEVIYDAKSGRRIADKLPGLAAEAELACLQCFPNGLIFYLNRTATLVTRDGRELTSNYILHSLNKGPQWPRQIVALADFDNWLASRKTPVYLIVRRTDREKLETLAAARSATVQTLSPDYLGAQLPAPSGP
jgi:4-amino-4-deoxy-L-arabinose transferase-like glycosyltransferase